MVRGPKKHMKRLAAPKSWMLEKLGGVYSCKPSSGPHKQGEFCDIWAFSGHFGYLDIVTIILVYKLEEKSVITFTNSNAVPEFFSNLRKETTRN